MEQSRIIAAMFGVFAFFVMLSGAVLATRSGVPVGKVMVDSGDSPINAPVGPINAPRDLFLAC
jgi:hypothetical protein